MNEVVIKAADLRKVYRLYARPSYRFLDMFGLLGDKPGACTEHAAVDGIGLEIVRGQKVAIIGRNGAGKSTLLKLVTNVIQPTSGRLEVTGDVHALLQIGTGFHPDFTGRENVYAYLAQLGVNGAEAARRCAEIVEFAELEEYIDQPVKTYSTGMGVRLMFSTATAITPDLLVLDEVLGVGDAYFAQKSYDRIRELCERKGTTLLLVTHDIYSAVNLCERAIWIDRGRVLMDGASPDVVKGYEDSIRQQEENRLRLRKQERLKMLQNGVPGVADATPVLIEVYAHENRPQPSPVYFSRVEVLAGGRPVAELPLGADAFDERMRSHLQREATSWGEAGVWQGRPARAFLNYGSPFHKIAGVITVPVPVDELDPRDLIVAFEYSSEQPCNLHGRCFIGRREIPLGPLPPSAGAWTTHQVSPGNRPIEVETALAGRLNTTGRHGTGDIIVLDVKATDESGGETYVLEHGEPAHFLIQYEINDERLREHSQVLLAFHRDGVLDTFRIFTRSLLFDARSGARGTIHLRVPRLMLANGTYTVTVMIAREGYYDRAQTTYFSLNPEVYTCLSRVIEIVVRNAGSVGTGTGVVGEGEWSLVDLEPAPVRSVRL